MKRILVVALMLIFSLTGLFSQETKIVNGYTVTRGERPVIDLLKVPVEAYEPGKLTIKIKPSIEDKLDARYIRATSKSYVETGIASFDAINKSIGAELYDRRFQSLLEMPGIHSVAKFEDRHRAWGFHLIYEVTFNKDQDVIAAVKQYSALEDVEYAEPVYKKQLVAPEKNGVPITDNYTSEKGDAGSKWTPNDPDLQPEQWHYENTGQTINGRVGVAGVDCRAYEAWDIETGNPDFIVAIVDQGVQYDHPDLAGNMWSGLGWDFGNDDATIEPDYHGTHVAGTVAAVTNNGIGVAGLAGGDGTANSGAKLMSCQVFGSTTGGFDLAMIWAADQGASISQNSWGYTSAGYFDQPLLDAIDYFNANGGGAGLQGGITIFASGNDNELETERYPGYYSGAMAVAGHDNQGKRYYNSNTGDYVEICAPAVDVHSTWENSGYNAITGTSMACPHVSGAAAMIVSNTEGVLTAPELRFILSESVWDIYQYETDPSYAGKLGPGALDASAALELAQSYLEAPDTPSLSLPLDGSTVTAAKPSFQWTDMTGASTYNILVDDDSNFSSPLLDQDVSTNSFTPTTDLVEGTYYWKVMAENIVGSSTYSSVWDVTVALPDINLSTTQINTTAAPDATTSDSFDIGNVGNWDLTYNSTFEYTGWPGMKADVIVEENDFESGLVYGNVGSWSVVSGQASTTTQGISTLTSTVFDGSVATDLWFDFDQANDIRNGGYFQAEWSDGSTWTQVLNITSTSSASQHIAIPNTAVQVRFIANVTRSQSTTGWQTLDNVVIYGPQAITFSWLTLDGGLTANGVVAASSSDNISVGCDAAGLTEGLYTADITITSDDPDEPSILLPVDFTVEVGGGPIIPAVPAPVTTSIVGSDLVIDWNDSADATGYDVYASDDPYGTFAVVASVVPSTYTVAADQAKLFYYIVAMNTTK